jgi:hypothetical protein
VALSNITILGGAAASFLTNSRRQRPQLQLQQQEGQRQPQQPQGRRSLIDWDLVLVMEPATMLGALLGSYANKVRCRVWRRPRPRWRGNQCTAVCRSHFTRMHAAHHPRARACHTH